MKIPMSKVSVRLPVILATLCFFVLPIGCLISKGECQLLVIPLVFVIATFINMTFMSSVDRAVKEFFVHGKALKEKSILKSRSWTV